MLQLHVATLAQGGRICVQLVNEEKETLVRSWRGPALAQSDSLAGVLSPEQIEEIDPFDRVQLEHVVDICRKARSLSEAGRAHSRHLVSCF